MHQHFFELWFTMFVKSLTCCPPTFSSGCKRSMNHLKEGLEHEAKHRCRYSAQYDNRIYTCKASTNPKRHTCMCWSMMMFWVSVSNFSGLLWGRKRGNSGSQNDGLVWLTVVWLGHLRLVWVSPAATDLSGEWLEMAFLLTQCDQPTQLCKTNQGQEAASLPLILELRSFSFFVVVFVKVCNRVPQLCSDLQKQAVLVWKPGPSGNSGQNWDSAHLAWGKATVKQSKRDSEVGWMWQYILASWSYVLKVPRKLMQNVVYDLFSC